MENVFLELFNMSITASWLVLAVIVFRFLFKKAPKSLRVIMWGLVALRLVCPVSLESVLSIIPSTEFVPSEIVYSDSSADVSGAEIFNAIGNNPVNYDLGIQDGSVVFTEYSAPDGNTVNPLLIITYIASIVWVVGMAVMLLYTLISYLRILKKVREATPLKENIWICDNISTPFILGLVKPRIFLPSSMNEQDTEFVIAHEKAHLKRHDHWWKPLGFALLTVYWFNPVLWVAYVLLCRDIELACDEKVIKEMGTEIKKSYSDALINCSVPRKMISACPLAFGETGVKGRIKSVLNYKKPAFWVIVVAVVAILITTICFMTNPEKPNDDNPSQQENNSQNNCGITNITNGSEYDGVSISFMSALFTGDSRNMEIEWNNETDRAIMFGEEIHIFKKNGTKWEECKLPENYAWPSIGYLVNADSTTTHKYGLNGYEEFMAGEYRVETAFFFDENPKENYKVWIEFELVSMNIDGDKYNPIELVYDNGMFSFVQTVDIAPAYYVTKGMKLTEVFTNGLLYERGTFEETTLNEENWDSRFSSEIWTDGYSYSKIKENNKKAWQLKVDNGEEDISILYLLLEQNDGTYFIAQGMYNNQSENPANKDDSLIRWLYLVEKNGIKISLEDTTKGEEDTTESTTEESTTEESTTKEYVPTPIKPLSTEKVIKIKQDYLEYRKKSVENTGNPNRYNNKSLEDITISQYFGTYDNCIVVSINMNSDIPPSDDIEEKIENYKFVYSSRKRGISVYRNGSFTSLSDAYEKGWLSKEDVRDIYHYHSTDTAIKNIYTPSPIIPLSTEKAIKIKQDYIKRYNVDDEDEKYFIIEEYFGIYNNCIVMLIDCAHTYATMEYEIEIAGYEFVFPVIREFDVYRNGEFTSLEKAYEKGWVSKEDVRDIHYYYSTDTGIKDIYTPSPLVSLTAKQELKIKQDYLEYKKEDVQRLRDSENQYYNSLSSKEQEKYKLEKGSPDNYIDELIENYLKIQVYFGTYNNCAVMILDSPFSVYFQAQTFNEIGGYVFAYPVMRSTAVYRNGEFVTLEQAYEKGWLSDENMKDIYYYHCKLYCDYEYKDGDFIIEDVETF